VGRLAKTSPSSSTPSPLSSISFSPSAHHPHLIIPIIRCPLLPPTPCFASSNISSLFSFFLYSALLSGLAFISNLYLLFLLVEFSLRLLLLFLSSSPCLPSVSFPYSPSHECGRSPIGAPSGEGTPPLSRGAAPQNWRSPLRRYLQRTHGKQTPRPTTKTNQPGCRGNLGVHIKDYLEHQIMGGGPPNISGGRPKAASQNHLLYITPRLPPTTDPRSAPYICLWCPMRYPLGAPWVAPKGALPPGGPWGSRSVPPLGAPGRSPGEPPGVPWGGDY
jgi:hypothetical protein